jgi:hypothetical protein
MAYFINLWKILRKKFRQTKSSSESLRNYRHLPLETSSTFLPTISKGSTGIHICRLGIIEKGGGRPSQMVSDWDWRRRPHSTVIATKSIYCTHEIISGNRPNNQSRHGADGRHRNVSETVEPFERNRIKTRSQTNIKCDETFLRFETFTRGQKFAKFRQGLERNY